MVEDGLRDRIPKPDVAFAQHGLAYPAGTIGTQAGPVLCAGDSIRIILACSHIEQIADRCSVQ